MGFQREWSSGSLRKIFESVLFIDVTRCICYALLFLISEYFELRSSSIIFAIEFQFRQLLWIAQTVLDRRIKEIVCFTGPDRLRRYAHREVMRQMFLVRLAVVGALHIVQFIIIRPPYLNLHDNTRITMQTSSVIRSYAKIQCSLCG